MVTYIYLRFVLLLLQTQILRESNFSIPNQVWGLSMLDTAMLQRRRILLNTRIETDEHGQRLGYIRYQLKLINYHIYFDNIIHQFYL